MTPRIASHFLLAALLGLSLNLTHAADKKETADPVVKKSDAGICHDKTSTSYGNTKKFTGFASMDECIKSGGRAAAGQPAAAADPIVKKSDSGICHDKNSPSYERTKKFTEFKTVDECVKSGGSLPKK
ncbi:hypothetical protein LMORI2_09450 [Limnohabitans sp. MORI2]|jgi:hypothetical protein|uniref:hypothetical protein n=1 Tax=Limnohabitans sp. MORI2 TaxID=1751150 RepID=UPI002376D21E|nr:hypothetical protein [Limnohabitans sp. MORI2]BDU57963.1 hypothetical protein LMORI2_09450 [Limnohabitans sp. MORI2]